MRQSAYNETVLSKSVRTNHTFLENSVVDGKEKTYADNTYLKIPGILTIHSE